MSKRINAVKYHVLNYWDFFLNIDLELTLSGFFFKNIDLELTLSVQKHTNRNLFNTIVLTLNAHIPTFQAIDSCTNRLISFIVQNTYIYVT